MAFQDLTGQRFGRLTAIKRAQNAKCGRFRWHCICECGTTRIVHACDLRSGKTKSCGCLKIEAQTTHGMTKTRTWNAWKDMKRRCLKENDTNYSNYGGRGITVCDRWLESFENFLEDMGECPGRMSLDRIDVNGNYETENCRWATWDQQQNNRRTSQIFTYQGKTQSATQWAREKGIKPDTLLGRLGKGQSIDEALNTPLRGRKIPGSFQ